MNIKQNRRTFLKTSAIAGAGLGLAPSITTAASWARILGANETINVGVVGCRNHGSWAHLEDSYLKFPNVNVIALCDPDIASIDRCSKIMFDAGARPAKAYQDIRKMLENKDIDAISVATPNHWHALATVWGCQAGKDVCVEKPVSHNIWEGRKMVEAAKKYGRIVQADHDIRSDPRKVEAIDFIQSGALGKIEFCYSWVYKRRTSIGKAGPQGGYIPRTVDYDIYCGPAPFGKLPRVNLHYDWHWQWDFGCGEIGNNGPHHLDLCRWILGHDDLPQRVITFGGRYGYEDDGETPNTSVTLYDYKPAPILFEVRGLSRSTDDPLMDPFKTTSRKGIRLYHEWESKNPHNANIIICKNGFVDMEGHIAYDNDGKKIREFEGESVNSVLNFVKAVRSRKEEDIKTPIINGHLSASLCHMGNISYRVGKEASYEEVHDQFEKDYEVLDALERTKDHLTANGLNMKQLPVVLGPWLNMDSKQERFTGDYSE
ncbi:MAG: Gfo/Idh/MocA family oxidoreductase, partial [Bacteroidales bacterium]|nr:Gfo/Idh/MocA family oxidoreductase [Bacteroidales bacterium]